MDIDLVENINKVDSLGRKHGLWRLFDSNGQLCREVNYVNGVLHGLWRSWHSNGQLCVEVNMLRGKMSGPFKTWTTDGDLCGLAYCVDDDQEGEEIKYGY